MSFTETEKNSIKRTLKAARKEMEDDEVISGHNELGGSIDTSDVQNTGWKHIRVGRYLVVQDLYMK